MPSDKHIFIVDDHTSMRRALRRLIEATPELAVAGEAATAEAALAAPELDAADLLLVDLNLPGMSGVDMTGELHARQPDYPCVVVSAFWEPSIVESALQAGAGGFASKCRSDALIASLEQVLAGERDVVAVGDG
ncbi:hypothetical protein BH24DEI2_BH24DEI2_15270 [soil metagenome]